MRLRQLKRIIWFACSGFTSRARKRIFILDLIAQNYDKAARRALIAGNKPLADMYNIKAKQKDAKAEHYRKFLRTH